MTRTAAAVAFIAVAGFAASAHAQARPTEVGVDLGVQWFPDGDAAVVSFPSAQLRLGLPLSQRVTFEPRTQVTIITGDGTFGVADITTGLRYDLGTSAARTAPYLVLLPEALLTFGDASSADFALGGGLGVQFGRSERMAWRLEGSVSYLFHASTTLVGGLLGATIFLP